MRSPISSTSNQSNSLSNLHIFDTDKTYPEGSHQCFTSMKANIISQTLLWNTAVPVFPHFLFFFKQECLNSLNSTSAGFPRMHMIRWHASQKKTHHFYSWRDTQIIRIIGLLCFYAGRQTVQACHDLKYVSGRSMWCWVKDTCQSHSINTTTATAAGAPPSAPPICLCTQWPGDPDNPIQVPALPRPEGDGCLLFFIHSYSVWACCQSPAPAPHTTERRLFFLMVSPLSAVKQEALVWISHAPWRKPPRGRRNSLLWRTPTHPHPHPLLLYWNSPTPPSPPSLCSHH